MAKKGPTPLTNVRLPEETLARMDALIPPIAATPEGAAGHVTRSYVLRRALAIGLTTLEEQYAPKGRRKA